MWWIIGIAAYIVLLLAGSFASRSNLKGKPRTTIHSDSFPHNPQNQPQTASRTALGSGYRRWSGQGLISK